MFKEFRENMSAAEFSFSATDSSFTLNVIHNGGGGGGGGGGANGGGSGSGGGGGGGQNGGGKQ